jgi:hypothetical protein
MGGAGNGFIFPSLLHQKIRDMGKAIAIHWYRIAFVLKHQTYRGPWIIGSAQESARVLVLRAF